MQITIVQTEIETAIRNYILGQITVRENQRIDIDLKATRGDQGFQAVIDIRPENDGPQGTKPKAAAPAAKPATAPVTIGKGPATKAAEAKVETKVEAETVAESKAAAEETAQDNTKAETLPEATEATETNSDEAPKEAPRSIFGGLRKPVNSTAAA